MNSHTTYSALNTVAIIVFVFLVALCSNLRAETQQNWSREPFLDTTAGDTTSPFTLVSISSIDDHLIGYCGYLDKRGKSPTAIKGSQTPGGDFSPDVIYQIGNDFEGEYKTIGKSVSKGKRLTLSIEPKDTNTILHVNLDVFRPMIRKYKFGRIVLKNGESTAFALRFLLPPEKSE